MRKVERGEILDYVTYEGKRNEIRDSAMAAKEKRRVHLGDHLTFLFENTETVRYQILEMIRVEKMVKEESISHEIETYNELLGDEGELGCTLLIAYDDEKERDIKLKELANLPKHIYMKLENGAKSYAKFDDRQVGDEKVSSVQFLKFALNDNPVGVGCDHPKMKVERELDQDQKQTLISDLAE